MTNEELWDWCCTEVYRLDNGKDVWKQINKVHQAIIKSKQQEKIEKIKKLITKPKNNDNLYLLEAYKWAISDVLKIMKEK